MIARNWYPGPEDEPEDSEDAYEPVDTIDVSMRQVFRQRKDRDSE